ncbi:hypothetical protein OC713_02645 [Sweet potato little leaf phytoplasma]|uniref:hypothetical protein n=1 Tax=Candidatus Phytoplasma australasiaticum TaxID=2754999 RepID=UPI0027131991|nr:hypothetical protein [Sweet potato little leaf phytoplasma]MDO7987402.1 hypothetical protein [Sweet potato little leaf phytoplasma]
MGLVGFGSNYLDLDFVGLEPYPFEFCLGDFAQIAKTGKRIAKIAKKIKLFAEIAKNTLNYENTLGISNSLSVLIVTDRLRLIGVYQ